jgi:hypothetical protein
MLAENGMNTLLRLAPRQAEEETRLAWALVGIEKGAAPKGVDGGAAAVFTTNGRAADPARGLYVTGMLTYAKGCAALPKGRRPTTTPSGVCSHEEPTAPADLLTVVNRASTSAYCRTAMAVRKSCGQAFIVIVAALLMTR